MKLLVFKTINNVNSYYFVLKKNIIKLQNLLIFFVYSIHHIRSQKKSKFKLHITEGKPHSFKFFVCTYFGEV